MKEAFIHTGCLDDATILGNITFQHCQATVFGIGMFQVTDATIGTVGIKFLIVSFLRPHHITESVGWSTEIDVFSLIAHLLGLDGIFTDFFCQGHAVNTLQRGVHQTAFSQLLHDGHDTTGTVHILHMVFVRIRSHLTEARHLTAQHIDVVHLEINSCLMSHRQQVQHRIGGATHSDVQ